MPPKTKITPPSVLRVVIIIIIAVIVAGLLIWQGMKKPITPPEENTFSVNLEDPNLPFSVVSGIVLQKSGDTFTLDIPSVFGVPIAADAPLRTRQILIGAATILTQSSTKTSADYEREMAEYQAKRARGEQAIPPKPSEETAITANDIKVGDYVRVIAENTVDIRAIQKVIAQEIIKES